jgi:hypothetical protein
MSDEAPLPGNNDHRPRSNTSSGATRNRNYGFAMESELLEYLRNRGVDDVERLALVGTEDEGDLVIDGGTGIDTLVQLKTFTPRSRQGSDRALTPGLILRWLRAQQEQAANYKAHRGLGFPVDTFLIVKIKGMSWDDAFVIQRLANVVPGVEDA